MDSIRSLHRDVSMYSAAVKGLENYIGNDTEPPDCDAPIKKFRSDINSTFSDITDKYSSVQSELSSSTSSTEKTKQLISSLERFTKKREDYLRQYGFQPINRDTPAYPKLTEFESGERNQYNIMVDRDDLQVRAQDQTNKSVETGEQTYVISNENKQSVASSNIGNILLAKYGIQNASSDDKKLCPIGSNTPANEVNRVDDSVKKRMQRYTMIPEEAQPIDGLKNPNQSAEIPEMKARLSKYAKLSHGEQDHPTQSGNKIANQARLLVQRYSIAPPQMKTIKCTTPPQLPASDSIVDAAAEPCSPILSLDEDFVDKLIAPDCEKLEEHCVQDLELTIQITQPKPAAEKQIKLHTSEARTPDLSDLLQGNSKQHHDIPSPPLTPFTKKQPPEIQYSPVIGHQPDVPVYTPISTRPEPEIGTPRVDALDSIDDDNIVDSGKNSVLSKPEFVSAVNDNDNVLDDKPPPASLQSLLAKYGSKYKK